MGLCNDFLLDNSSCVGGAEMVSMGVMGKYFMSVIVKGCLCVPWRMGLLSVTVKGCL